LAEESVVEVEFAEEELSGQVEEQIPVKGLAVHLGLFE
jgi:hypothetical protein